MRSLNEYIIEQLLTIDESQLESFINNLKPETRAYLDVVLAKAENNLPQLRAFLRS